MKKRNWAGIAKKMGICLAAGLEHLVQSEGFAENLLSIGPEEDALSLVESLALADAPVLAAAGSLLAQDPAPDEETAPSQVPATSDSTTADPSPSPTETSAVEPLDISALDVSGIEIKNGTSYDIDVPGLWAEVLNLSLAADEPQILIIHTHGSEAYTPDGEDIYEPTDPSRTEDTNYNVVRLGDILAEKFTAAGLNVIHDRQLYDYPSYNGSYSRSLASIENYLAQYPSIQIVIDLHRDALSLNGEPYATSAGIDGVDASQVMVLVGTDEAGLAHPNWRENMKFAILLQAAMDAKYPGLARPISIKQSRYNQDMTYGSIILEVGSHGNTLQQAIAGIELFAESTAPALLALVQDSASG